jgi:hypothetical protein
MVSKLTLISGNESEVYYICQPSPIQQRVMPSQQKQTAPAASQATVKAVSAPLINGSKWSADDH